MPPRAHAWICPWSPPGLFAHLAANDFPLSQTESHQVRNFLKPTLCQLQCCALQLTLDVKDILLLKVLRPVCRRTLDLHLMCTHGHDHGDLQKRAHLTPTHLTPLILHRSSHTTRHTPRILRHLSRTSHLTPLISAIQRACRRTCGTRRWAAPAFRLAGPVHRAFRRTCGTRGRLPSSLRCDQATDDACDGNHAARHRYR